MNAPTILPIKVPFFLQALKCWVVWRYMQKPGEPKPRKVPYYPRGHIRSGKQGGYADRAALGTYEQANATYQKGGFDGIGIAMLKDWGMVALDFDGCVVDGKIRPSVEALIAGTYSEISPSGTGVRAIMRGFLPSRKSPILDGRFGFETFSENGFVTLTGNITPICDVVGNENTIEDVTPEILALYEERFGPGASTSTGSEPATDPLLTYIPKLGLAMAELTSLTMQLDPDAAYLDDGPKGMSWLKVGMAIHHETDGNEHGLNLFDEWSRGSKTKYPGRHVIESKWNSFDISPGTTVTARSIVRHVNIKMAREQGKAIVNPKNTLATAKMMVQTNFMTESGVTLARYMDEWYLHNGQCFKTTRESDIRAKTWYFLDRCLKSGPKGSLIAFMPTKGQVDATVDALCAVTSIGNVHPPCWREGYSGPHPKDLISLKNGLLHVPTRQLLPHTPGFFTINSMPYEWDERAECPGWYNFIEQLWPGDAASQETLQEIFGYLLTADTSQHKMFLIVGPRRSGKGTIARVISALLGKENVVSPQLSGLTTQFGLQPLIDKLVALIPDARVGGHTNIQAVVERLLMISGEDSISVDRKHKDTWSGTMAARFFLLTNEMPQLGDASGALSGRFITLSLCESFYGKEDPTLSSKLLLELAAIFKWALDGKDRLARRGHFLQPESGAEDAEDLAELGSPISVFVKEMCELGPDNRVSIQEIYNAWRQWCQLSGRTQPGTKSYFGKLLRAAYTGIRKVQTKVDGSRPRAYSGIQLKDESDL